MLNKTRWLGLALLALFLGGCSSSIAVSTIQPQRGQIQSAFRETARTRLSKEYPVALQIGGRIGRIDLEPGDPVKKGQTLVDFDQFPVQAKSLADQQAISQLEAEMVNATDLRLESAEEAQLKESLRAAQAEVRVLAARTKSVRVNAEQAEHDRVRTAELVKQGALPSRDLEAATVAESEASSLVVQLKRQESVALARVSEIRARIAGVQQKKSVKLDSTRTLQAQIAKARTEASQSRHTAGLTSILSPLDGVVLERLEQGPKELPAGTELLILGRLDDLEALAEVLTQDATALKPGDPAELETGRSDKTILGRVTKVEPSGFTKLSSLGVEQQRVNVIISLPDLPEGIKVGYKLRARFITEMKDDVLKLPQFSVLQDEQGRYYVFRVEDGVESCCQTRNSG